MTHESIAPDGARYAVPSAAEIDAAFERIAQRAKGQRVVAVQGLGFVGAAVATAIASARDAAGKPRYFVIGTDLATPEAFWKIAKINAGDMPIECSDVEFAAALRDAATSTANLAATSSPRAYELAETIVVDVHLDVLDRTVSSAAEVAINRAGFENAIRAIGRSMNADALVLVETTVPFGASERIVLPILREERERRGITAPVRLAHVYERVMPGPNYLRSIRGFWRTFAGIDAESAERARAFLDSFTDTQNFPARQLEQPAASEFAKILENSYRSANIAFMHEWTLLAERVGIDLWSVVDSIRVRKGTHDNMRYPGFGVGGYCLTKDSLLAAWSARNLFQVEAGLDVTMNALRINHLMPLHTLHLLQELAGGDLSGKRVLVCGISYLPDLSDTRNSPTEIFVDELLRLGAEVTAHDPCVPVWSERPNVKLASDPASAFAEADAIVFAVPHRAYRALETSSIPAARWIVDANNILDDTKATTLHRAGSRILGVGKGHWRARGLHLSE